MKYTYIILIFYAAISFAETITPRIDDLKVYDVLKKSATEIASTVCAGDTLTVVIGYWLYGCKGSAPMLFRAVQKYCTNRNIPHAQRVILFYEDTAITNEGARYMQNSMCAISDNIFTCSDLEFFKRKDIDAFPGFAAFYCKGKYDIFPIFELIGTQDSIGIVIDAMRK